MVPWATPSPVGSTRTSVTSRRRTGGRVLFGSGNTLFDSGTDRWNYRGFWSLQRNLPSCLPVRRAPRRGVGSTGQALRDTFSSTPHGPPGWVHRSPHPSFLRDPRLDEIHLQRRFPHEVWTRRNPSRHIPWTHPGRVLLDPGRRDDCRTRRGGRSPPYFLSATDGVSPPACSLGTSLSPASQTHPVAISPSLLSGGLPTSVRDG